MNILLSLLLLILLLLLLLLFEENLFRVEGPRSFPSPL